MKVRFTPAAREHFLDAITYIRSNTPLAAARFRARAGKVLRRLTPHPGSGRRIPEFPVAPHREVIVAPQRAVRAEVRRRELMVAGDAYVTELAAQVGAPSARERARAADLARRVACGSHR